MARHCRRTFFAAATLAALLTIAAPIAFSQATTAPMPDWQTAAGGKMEFDVASVRESPSDAPMRAKGISALNADPIQNGLFSANAPLLLYIIFAYKITDVSQYQMLLNEMPKWAPSARFDIEARADGTPTRDQTRLMMQSLLADRFKLAIHSETKDLPIYALVLDKPGKLGPQLQPHPADVVCSDQPDQPAQSAPDKAPDPHCGITFGMNAGLMHIKMTNVTMDEIASYLGGGAVALGDADQRSVVDQTGLTGHYDVTIDFAHSVPLAPANAAAAPVPTPDTTGPTVVVAMRSQLGLKMVKQTGPVTVFVIDHVEMPSAN